MMDDPEYRKRFGEKMEAHREGKDLIVTYGDRNSGLDTLEMLTVLTVNRILWGTELAELGERCNHRREVSRRQRTAFFIGLFE